MCCRSVQGRVVLFELAPIDPRSLMQGDYMALRFAIDGALPRRDGASAGRLPRFAYLDVDAEGRARLVGVGDELPESSARVAVRIRMRDGAPSVGPNAFFFQEGQADVFAGARWGELRVAADGTALLADLRDENLQRLGAPRR
ncbi:GDYXXLXY domain-containing protein [Thauera sp. GDN1]|uniref:GDYXXLXY domain-containing protein n=1 Tax=Thauera sp. GDN1 TaxID=2944810 RepID=UPI0032AEECEB